MSGSVERLTKDPYGYFEFAPAEGLDLDLLDRVPNAVGNNLGRHGGLQVKLFAGKIDFVASDFIL